LNPQRKLLHLSRRMLEYIPHSPVIWMYCHYQLSSLTHQMNQNYKLSLWETDLKITEIRNFEVPLAW